MGPSWRLIRYARFAVLVVMTLVALPAAIGQVSALKNAIDGKAAAAQKPAEKPEEIRKRLETWQQEARDQLARFESGGTAAALPEGISQAELDDRRRDLEQMMLAITAALKNHTAVGEARKSAEDARAEEKSWSGFAEPPPYSILMLDELLNERDAVKAKLSSNEASLANFERLLAGIITETKTAEEAASGLIAAVQNAGEDKAESVKWRLEAARAKSRLFAARAGLLQASCDSFRERVAASKAELELVERKIRIASPHVRFTEEDLARVQKISNERKKAAEKEITAISKRLKSALATRNQAQAALDGLPAESADGKPPEGLELARFRVEVAEGRVESLQALIEGLESLIQLENHGWKVYQDRHVAMTAADPEQRAKSLEALKVMSDRMRAWLSVTENDMSACGADLSKIESRAASIPAEDPRFPLLNEQRASRSEKLAMLQRVHQAVSIQRKLLRRWLADFAPPPAEQGWFARLSTLAAGAWENVRKVWSFQVMSFEDKLEVDGQTITGRIPVTLGMLLRALMFFGIGYWIAARFANRLQRTIVSRGHIAEAQARTLRNWAMIFVGLFLVIGTLSFLKIPLTVFAFFGGALAIGIGFGTQTLIKNFISGIIVLAERKIRVGDTLDVDGIIGTVTEVNTRSSIIRSPDDVETMIPNSMFLENRVTNWTLSNARMRRSLRVGVAYGTHPPQVMQILTESAARHGLVCKDPPPFAVFEDFGDNALIFTLYFWVDLRGGANAMVIASDLRLMIEKRFTEAAIGIPFPQRDMHLTTDRPIAVQMVDPEDG